MVFHLLRIFTVYMVLLVEF